MVGATEDILRVPSVSLRIGVTGHRSHRLTREILPAVLATATKVISVLFDIARSMSLRAGEPVRPPDLRIASCYADGTDMLLSDAGLARGCLLDIVLPFPAQDYATTVPQAQRSLILALHDAPQVASLHCPGPVDMSDEAARAAAYLRAGRLMLDQCDLLLAVWDGQPERGEGGTAQIISHALERGMQVAWIDLEGKLRVSSRDACHQSLLQFTAVSAISADDMLRILGALVKNHPWYMEDSIA